MIPLGRIKSYANNSTVKNNDVNDVNREGCLTHFEEQRCVNLKVGIYEHQRSQKHGNLTQSGKTGCIVLKTSVSSQTDPIRKLVQFTENGLPGDVEKQTDQDESKPEPPFADVVFVLADNCPDHTSHQYIAGITDKTEIGEFSVHHVLNEFRGSLRNKCTRIFHGFDTFHYAVKPDVLFHVPVNGENDQSSDQVIQE
ncbi:hypothetical protein D3C86_1476150 [compost metagenome]